MAFTVTATQSGASANAGVYLLIRVLTGAVEAGGASNGGNSLSQATASGSLTPSASNSLPVFSISADQQSAVMPAAATNNTYYTGANVNNAAHSWSWAAGFYSGTVTSGTAITYGASVNAGNDHANWCAYEIKPSGGTTPAVDGSSPAVATTDSALTITTASFTPPNGSVLVALTVGGASGSGAGISMAITDTSGLSLTWTQRITSSSSDNFQPTFIHTTTVGSAATSGPPLSPQFMGGMIPSAIVAGSGWRGANHSR